MIERFRTERDHNGNTYTLTIDHTAKTFNRDYNPWNYTDFVKVTKRDRGQMIEALETNGYTEI